LVSGPVDPTWLTRRAQELGFNLDLFEQAYRLAHLLGELGANRWLGSRLALKGGTCINLFHSDLPRLSVDMDLNYVGSANREIMREERPVVMDTVRNLAREHGYVPEDIRMSYAGWTARLVYESVRDSTASIKVDVNFLNRVPLFQVERLPIPVVLELGSVKAPCLAVDDVYGGKLKALAVRGEPRDVFDAALLFSGGVVHDPAQLRKAFLFYGFMDDASLSTFDLGAIGRLGPREYEQRLYPVLRRGDRPDPVDLADLVVPRLDEMLDLTEDEVAFGRGLEDGEYLPELLFGDVQVSDDIGAHPAAEWRRLHPHGRVDQR
jgi:predicted nucleotidyltransferase component of viral defense system